MSKVSKLLFSCILLGSTIGTVQAETQYVTENLNTYLRKGAGDQFKIAGAIQSGEAVTVLGQEGKYTLIRDNKNREAWILTSELSATPSSREENPRLKAQVQELTLKLSRVDSDWQQRTTKFNAVANKRNNKAVNCLNKIHNLNVN